MLTCLPLFEVQVKMLSVPRKQRKELAAKSDELEKQVDAIKLELDNSMIQQEENVYNTLSDIASIIHTNITARARNA